MYEEIAVYIKCHSTPLTSVLISVVIHMPLGLQMAKLLINHPDQKVEQLNIVNPGECKSKSYTMTLPSRHCFIKNSINL